MSKRFRSALRESFGFKIISAVIVVIIVTLTAYTVIGAVREGNKVKDNLKEQGEMLAGIVAHGSVVGIFAENEALLGDAASGVLGLRDVLSVAMYNADRKMLYAGGRAHPDDGRLSLPAPAQGVTPGAGPLTLLETSAAFEFIKPVTNISLSDAGEAVYFGPPGRAGTSQVLGYVKIVLSKEAYRDEIVSVVARNAGMMLIFIVAGGVTISLAVRKVTRPLERLTVSVKALEKGLPVEPAAAAGHDEIGKLAAAFNDMVAARGKAEETLRESEERYRRLVELSPDAIYVQREGKIAFMNAAGARLLGVSDPSRIPDLQAAAFIHPADHELLRGRFRRVLESGTTLPFLPLRYLRPDKTVVDAEAAAAPFLFRGAPAVLVIARDVTERKGMEDAIRSYQNELRKATLERSLMESRIEERERHLIAADLHDFVGQNTVALQFKLAAFYRTLPPGDTAGQFYEIQELAAKIVGYTRSLTVELCPPVLTEVGLEEAVVALADGFETAHGVSIVVEDDGRPKQTDRDVRYLLFRSVRELLMNVVKHAGASTVNITMAADNGNLRIAVADDGAGFDAPAAARKSRGFGLFMIRERLKSLGGYCEIESALGAGSTVVLVAPLARAAPEEGGA